MTKSKRPVRRTETRYPDRASRGADCPVDSSRRRFLRQIATTTSGVGLLASIGLPRLGHGQSHEVDFSVLDAHPAAGETAQPAEAPMQMASPPTAAPAPAPAAAPPAVAAQAPADPPSEERITEDRALWIEPGYLVLIRWTRPVANTAVVAMFEGSTDALQAYLSSHITEANDLHALDQLHAHEQALLALLEPRIAPARVEKLHLDHDCNTVCNVLGWGGPTGPEIPLPGVAPPIEWE